MRASLVIASRRHYDQGHRDVSLVSTVSPAKSPETVRFGASTVAWAAYLVTLGSMAMVGVLVPLMARMAERLGASMGDLGFAIGLYSLPAAVASIGLGSISDRIGPRLAVLIAALLALVADVLMLRSASLFALQGTMLLGGVANALMITAIPALLMTALRGGEQVRAMSLWSTYGPAGYALGLLICAPFADRENWSFAIVTLCGVMALGIFAALIGLPNPPRAERSSIPLHTAMAEVIAVVKKPGLLRISLTYAVVAAISYGSSLAAPGYLHKVYGVSMSSSATAIAGAKIVAMLLGGVAMGWLLSGARDRFALFLVVAAIGLAAQVVLYFPGSGMILATGAMIVWLFVYGAISATCFVMLAHYNDDPAKGGIASGLIGQLASIGCFFAPGVYFSLTSWTSFVLVAGAGLALSLSAFPRGRVGTGTGQ